MAIDKWLLREWPTTGRYLEYMRVTYGWSLMLIVVFAVLYFRYLDAKQDGRLENGIDPPWMVKSDGAKAGSEPETQPVEPKNVAPA